MSRPNPLIAPVNEQQQWFAGIGPIEGLDMLINGIDNGSWLEIGLGTAGVALEAVSAWWDPVGALLRWAASWVMEHLEPAKQFLDKLAGNPPVIEAYATTWRNVSKLMTETANDIDAAVAKDVGSWQGGAADTYRAQIGEKVTALREAAKLCDGSGRWTSVIGTLVGTVRGVVREMIAALVAWLVKSIGLTVLTGPFGASEAVRTAVTEIARVTNMIVDVIGKLMKSLANLQAKLPGVLGAFDQVVGKLAPKGARTSVADAPPLGAVRPAAADVTVPSSTVDAPRAPAGTPHTGTPDGGPPATPGDPTPGSPNGHGPTQGGRPDTPPPREDGGGGQRAEGNDGVNVRAGDPVDVVSGQMITSKTDLALPGLLPLVAYRAYASDFRAGRLLGPGWSSTLDQRLEIDDEFVRYVGDDAQVLWYPNRPAEPVLPLHGARWPLTMDPESGTYRIEDPETGWVRHFAELAERSSNTVAVGGEPAVRPITALTDRDGHEVAYARDPAGLPLAIRHSGGYYVAVDVVAVAGEARIGALRLIDQQAHGVTAVSYQYDEGGRLAGVVNSSGLPYHYEYDNADRITAWVDRNGFRYEYHYGADGRVVRGRSAGGHLDATFDYDLANRVTSVTNSLGHVTKHHYDRHNHVTAVVDPLGNTELTEYDRYNRLLSRTDALGNTTRWVRDEHGGVLRVEYADGTHTSVENDERWRLPARVIEPGGVEWRHSYSATGNVLATTDPTGAVTASELDGRGHLVATVAADGQRTTFTSDGAGRPTSATSPLGATTRYDMDGFGRLAATTDPRGAVTRYGWTVEGRLAWQAGPDGARQELSYDPEGNLLRSQDPDGATTTFEVGPFNLMVARTGPDGTRYTFDHDTELRLVRVTNPLGLTWDYEYDPAGNLVRENDFTGRTVTYRYDAAGQQVGRVEESVPALTLVRDARGRVVAQQVEGERRIEFELDAAGRLRRAGDGTTEVVYERDALGRPVVESIDGRAVRSEYDVLGRRIRRSTPSGVETRWTYTRSSQLATLTGTAGTLSFEYDPAGRETTRRLGRRAALTQVYDDAGRLAAQHVWAHPSTDPAAPDVPANRYQAVQQRTYRYRADGVVTAVGDRLRGDRAYELTAAGRVTAVAAATWSERYAYDALGNVVTAQPGTRSGTEGTRAVEGLLLRGAGRDSYIYDDAGRLVRHVRRTLSGQQRVWSYTWNGHHQLVGATTPDGATWRYRYDPFGRRVAKQRVDSRGTVLAETTFSWDGAELAEQWQHSAERVTATAWDYRGGTGEPLAQTSRSWLADAPDTVIDSRFHAIVSDLVGSPTELVGEGGRISWYRTENLWGDEIAVSSPDGTDCPLRFPGQYHDRETGLHYNFHRYYDPATARYLSPDPVGLRPSPNNYTYVANPLVVCDPFGLAGHRGANGQYAIDPNAPRTTHTRDTEYPHDYWKSTHDTMSERFTLEGQTQGRPPLDANGVPIPRDQLSWVDANGNRIPFDQLTYDHNPAAVQHWNAEGYDQTRAQREAWYNNTDGMEAMHRSENSRRGAMLTERYSDRAPGPNYSCG